MTWAWACQAGVGAVGATSHPSKPRVSSNAPAAKVTIGLFIGSLFLAPRNGALAVPRAPSWARRPRSRRTTVRVRSTLRPGFRRSNLLRSRVAMPDPRATSRFEAVVGAGVGGLGAALRAAELGHHVAVFEPLASQLARLDAAARSGWVPTVVAAAVGGWKTAESIPAARPARPLVVAGA